MGKKTDILVIATSGAGLLLRGQPHCAVEVVVGDVKLVKHIKEG
jgi:hypothetical protein